MPYQIMYAGEIGAGFNLIRKRLIVKPWAKINLYLKILDKRSDGYHDIISIIHPIALFDELIIERIDDGLIVNCKNEKLLKSEGLPLNRNNLVTKAVTLFFEKIGLKPSVKIDLIKRIPIGGGLGGGSSDAASTLTVLNKLYGKLLNNEILHDICSKLGMDAPFFLKKSPALCMGRGEIIEKRYKSINFWCVLINPNKNLSTRDVYNTFNLNLTGRETTDNISRFANPVRGRPAEGTATTALGRSASNGANKNKQGILKLDLDTYLSQNELSSAIDIKDHIYNDLENAAEKLCPEIGIIKDFLQKAGVIKSFVCGSGSTVCGLVDTKRQAEEVIGKIPKERYKDWWFKAVSSL